MITLASREFRVLLILPTCLRCLRIFGFVGVAWCCDPTFVAYPHGLLLCGPFIGFLGLCGVRPGYCCVGDDRCDDYYADSSASLAQYCSCGGFYPSFAIFALVWGLLFFLRNFRLYSLGYTFGVAFFAPSVSSPLLSLLR